jgi:uncharacterized protein YacL
MQPQMNLPSEYGEVSPRRVIAVAALLLYTAIWLAQSFVTGDKWLNDLVRPYLADWAILAIAFSVPITAALAWLDAIPLGHGSAFLLSWRVNVFFAIVLSIQGALFGLIGERYRWVQGGMTLFLYLEVYLILPRLERRKAEQKQDGTILDLK